MKLLLLFFVALLSFPCLSQIPRPQNEGFKYVGLKYSGSNDVLIDGFREIGGGLITNVDANPLYSISHLKNDFKQMLLLNIGLGSDETNIPRWQVKDVLLFQSLKKNQSLLFGPFNCQRRKKYDEKLVVLAEFIQRQKIYKIHQAWRVNTKTESFQKIPITGITCFYEEP